MSGYYPGGLTDRTPGCPWSEQEVPEKEFDVTCSQSLSRTTTVCTDDYIPCAEDVWDDGVGHHDEWADTSETDWKKAYSYEHKTPLELIGLLKEYLEKDLRDLQRDMLPNDRSYKATKSRMLKGLIEECECWTEDETEICEG